MSSLPLRLAILVSGGGSTMAQVIQACDYGPLQGLVQPAVVVASQKGIGALNGSKLNGVPPVICGRKDFPTRDAFGLGLLEIMATHQVDVILQAGWTCLTPANVVNAYRGRIFNQHPGPLDHGHPDFGGQGMIGLAVHDARIRFLQATNPPEHLWFTEVVCHHVTERYDDGAVIWSGRVPVRLDDTAETLQERALPVEWAVQIAALLAIATGTVREIEYHNRLVLLDQVEILEQCKAEATRQYPYHG